MKVEPLSVPDQGTSEGDGRRTLRRVLMIVVPAIAVIVGVAAYALTGRYVSTDNTYVKADIVAISPEISGVVNKINVTENQRVTQGQVLLTVDATQYTIGLAEADAEIRSAAAKYDADRAHLKQKDESLRMAQTDASFADRELKRQAALGAGRFVAVQKIDEVQHTRDTAIQKIALLKQEQAEILARLDGKPDLPLEQYPSYQSGLAKRAAAEYFLGKAVIRAPFDGIVSHVPKVGDFARTGVPALNLVSSQVIWIDANYKETDLTYIRPSQPVDIHVDTYPGRVFKGHIDSIAQASGGEFALLPAQNSTGNWVKVVQRIPVRVAIDNPPSDGPVLRAGMSVTVDADTGARRLSRWLGKNAD